MIRNDVLIIGAGPSGLFAAAELARHGVEARLIERDLQPHREARATSIQPGTLEILETVGLLPPFLEAAERIHCSRLYGPGMSEIGSMSHDGIGCRGRAERSEDPGEARPAGCRCRSLRRRTRQDRRRRNARNTLSDPI